MERYFVSHREESVARLLRAAGVETHKPVTLEPRERVTIQGTYWDGGSKTVYTALGADGITRTNLQGWQPFGPGGLQPPSPAPIVELLPLGDTRALPAFVIESGTFCGKPATVRILAHPSRLTPLLPAPTTLSESERRVLLVACAFNSKGRDRWRDEGRVMREDWEAVVALLVARGMMRRGGSVTPEGRNAVERDSDRFHIRFRGLTD